MAGLRRKYPEHSAITATGVHESVIVHWLKRKDIRLVQYLAGRKYMNSTARYQALDLEHLKERAEQFHSLK